MIYSKEFRREVLAACDARLGTRKVALQFNVSESWVRRIKQERRGGKLGPATKRRRTPKWVAEADAIQAAIAKQPDLTLSELKAELQTSLSRTSLCRALQQLRLTLKKVLGATEQRRPDVAERRVMRRSKLGFDHPGWHLSMKRGSKRI